MPTAPPKRQPPAKKGDASIPKGPAATVAPAAPESGDYPWLHNRLKSAIVDASPADQQKVVRGELKDLVDPNATLHRAAKLGIIGELDALTKKFLSGFIRAGVTKAKGK